ncbi:aminoglycoside phosphotransferase family protein [Actinocrispum sp. NPDC049592]|uniref:aminoglycoside phosphotransferase family protein n=1 Tax=Actinocrispum sp. NPDC049592 TaxID=3154835 RepID=UPI00342EE157
MHTDEAEIDVPLVRRLITEQFPQWADLPVADVISSGTDNAMYRLGEDMAVRLPRIPWAVPNVDREHAWLPRLADELPVPIPVPLGRGEPGAGYPWPWSVVRWMPGENPCYATDPLARDLADFILALRRIDPANGPRQDRGRPLRTRDDTTRKAIDELTGMIDTAAVAEIWAEAVALPEWRGPELWSHGDLSPGNVLVRNGRLSAVIDLAGAGVGDPTVDLIVAWNLLRAEARDLFREALDVDDVTWLRGRAWALSIALIQLPYYQHTNPQLAENARHVIREVLTDAAG